MILMPQIFDVTANENARYKRNELECKFSLRVSSNTHVTIFKLTRLSRNSFIKVLRPSDPNYWKNVEWIPYVFSKEYCSACQTITVMGHQFGTITFCHL